MKLSSPFLFRRNKSGCLMALFLALLPLSRTEATIVSEQSLRDAVLNRISTDATTWDLNQDGKVNVADLVLASRYATEVSFAYPSTTAVESLTTVNVPLTFTRPLSGVIQYDVSGTAVSGTDFIPLTGSLSVNGTNATCSIQLKDDLAINDPRTIILKLRSPPTNSATFALGAQCIHTVFINDNDATWQGQMTTDGLQLPFTLAILQSNTVYQASVTSDGSGALPAGLWPTVLTVNSNAFFATIGPIAVQNTNTLLNVAFSEWLYLSSVPATNAQHALDMTSSIVGSIREEFIFQDASQQHLNRVGTNAVVGTFTLQKTTPKLTRTQPTLITYP